MSIHIRSRRLLLLSLLLLLGIAALIFRECRIQGGDSVPTIIHPPLHDVLSITLSQRMDTLHLTQQNGVWSANGRGADRQLVENLMESLAALKPEQPIESQRQMDSMEGHFLRHGLNVQIITQAGKNLDYSIAPWQDALLVFTEPSRPGKFYTCSLPGYRSEVLLNIALSAPLWQRQHLGVARPNEIKAVNVAWCNPWEEFTVVVDSVSGHAKVYDDRKSAPIHYDTLRLSTFLYSLTQLEYQPATAEQSAQYAQSLQEGRGELFRLTILRQSMDTLIYSIYATPEESDKDSTDPDRAIIRLSEGQYGTIQLSKWALTMVHVDALREREALR